jgi:elongator complex protein 1
MHLAMRGHGASIPTANILKARAVEQGSRIVAVPPDDIYIVLQLPRGNLETIFPRSLVLPAIAAAIKVRPVRLACLRSPDADFLPQVLGCCCC